jgi:protein-L-isoaspartate O-methyltransferase
VSAGLAEILTALEACHAGREHTYKMTPLGMWACSDAKEVHDIFIQVGLQEYGHIADLGSGDGRVVLLASLFTQATGLEADGELATQAQGMSQGLGLKRARFIQGDCRRADLAPYDLLFLYPDKPLDWLEALLPADWSGHMLIYGPHFKPQRMTYLKTFYAGRTICGLWSA